MKTFMFRTLLLLPLLVLSGCPASNPSTSGAVTATKVDVQPAQITMSVGDSLTLTANVTNSDGTVNGNVTWSSSDNTRASVDAQNGKVTAVAAGVVSIKATSVQTPSVFGLCQVTVR